MRIDSAPPLMDLVTQRLRLLFAVCAGYFGAFVPILLLGGEGLWLAMILGLFGLPFLGLAVVASLIWSRRIAESPWKWSLIAAALSIIISTLGFWIWIGSLAGALTALPALFAPVVFNSVLRLTGD